MIEEIEALVGDTDAQKWAEAAAQHFGLRADDLLPWFTTAIEAGRESGAFGTNANRRTTEKV